MTPIPSEARMVQVHGVARETVRQAVRFCVRRGGSSRFRRGAPSRRLRIGGLRPHDQHAWSGNGPPGDHLRAGPAMVRQTGKVI
ncbi:hypothetical protein OG884_27270 [Streptosporangium sp. NBC_01755]|nr:hypothetical protein [Streptosporangium sp. NBC_01810]WSA29670.1 hypothetical protein OIE13_20340 [Streptosporangium sp. NBC_01810]WSD04189.1 hypothetical protein OG884_27270 [Streptosporangium sp. NBC_01755]